MFGTFARHCLFGNLLTNTVQGHLGALRARQKQKLTKTLWNLTRKWIISYVQQMRNWQIWPARTPARRNT